MTSDSKFSRFFFAFTFLSFGLLHSSISASCDADFFITLVKERYVAPLRAGNAHKWAAAFAHDAVALHNRRPPDHGREAIEQFGQMVSRTFAYKRFDVTVDEVRCEGAWVLTRGSYRSHLVFRESGQDAPWGPEWGSFVLLWEETNNGAWEITLDMGNSNGPEETTP